MTHNEAVLRLKSDVLRGEMISPKSGLANVDREALRVVLGMETREIVVPWESGRASETGTSGASPEENEALSVRTAASAPACALAYGPDVCALPLGHTEECQDADGNLLEAAF